MKPDEPRVDMCECMRFVFWYLEEVSVCRCGHPDQYHIGNAGLCVGEVEVR